jgi:hypothetical protein
MFRSQQYLYWSVSYTHNLFDYIPSTVFLGSLEVENNTLGNAALEERNIKKSEDIKVLVQMMSVC